MSGNKAKLKFSPNNFEIVENGDYVVCAVSGKNIPLNKLNYKKLIFHQKKLSKDMKN